MGAYQDILARGQLPDWQTLLPVLILGILFCLMAIRLFRKSVGDMMDEL